MEKLKKLFEKVLVKPLNKLANFRVVKSISAGLQSTVGILMVGAFLSVISIILGLIPSVAQSTFLVHFNAVKELTFGITGILFAYAIASADAKLTKTDQQTAGFFAVLVFFIFMKPTLSVDENYVTSLIAPLTRMGLQSMLVAIIAAIWASEVFAFFKKRNWMINSDGLPDIAKVWFEYLIAGTFVVLVTWAVTYLLNLDLHVIFTVILSPLLGIFSSFWGWVLITSIGTLAFFFGIHTASILILVSPIYYIALANNAQLLASGLAPTVDNGFIIINMGFMLFMGLFGGSGATLGLNILMLFSKNESVKKLGRVAIIPSLVNINEPLIFGLPIFYNPIFLLPFLLVVAVNSALAYLTMYVGWVNIPSNFTLLQFLPAPIGGYLLTSDFRAVILAVVILLVDLALWAPFLKMHEKKLAAEATEKAEAAA
ncbi:MAG: PTS sugar transporter subunit IIC [Anaerolineaceae bacterium]|nr:PTS sugar transporter subunit IIC [Anaerolineaceae bacterium]